MRTSAKRVIELNTEPAAAGAERGRDLRKTARRRPAQADALDSFVSAGGRPTPGAGRSRGAPLIVARPKFRRLPLVPAAEPELAAPIPAVLGVPVELSRALTFEGASNGFLHPSALTTLEVRFGRLSPAQTEALSSAFGGRSHVGWDPQRSYEVRDFLPPAVQALIDLDLEPPEAVVLPDTRKRTFDWLLPRDEDKIVSLTADCHGTAYAAVRAFQGHDADVPIFIGDPLAMDDLTASNHFERIADLKGPDLADIAGLPLRPGDVVQLFEDVQWGAITHILHSAVYVGGGLFFEKPNTEMAGEDSPYRLATFEMVLKPVAHFAGHLPKVRVSRPRGLLPEPEVIFESGFRDALERNARRKGRSIGLPLVRVMSYSLGGGTNGEQLVGITRFPIELASDGRGRLSHPRA